jgi:uncharacterized protein (TIGR03435 family)
MGVLANSLSSVPSGLGRPVIDGTGLKGSFDFTLEFAPESSRPAAPDSSAAASEPAGPTVLEALRDQLGLKLESTKGPIQVLVIDRVERPRRMSGPTAPPADSAAITS